MVTVPGTAITEAAEEISQLLDQGGSNLGPQIFCRARENAVFRGQRAALLFAQTEDRLPADQRGAIIKAQATIGIQVRVAAQIKQCRRVRPKSAVLQDCRSSPGDGNRVLSVRGKIALRRANGGLA